MKFTNAGNAPVVHLDQTMVVPVLAPPHDAPRELAVLSSRAFLFCRSRELGRQRLLGPVGPRVLVLGRRLLVARLGRAAVGGGQSHRVGVGLAALRLLGAAPV